MTYAITNPEGITTYDITHEEMMSMYIDGCRCWESDNGGLNYTEIFI